VRRLAKRAVRLVSIIQELGDDPTSSMIRQIMALFDAHKSKENARHTLRAIDAERAEAIARAGPSTTAEALRTFEKCLSRPI
jgi:hypothetical protein